MTINWLHYFFLMVLLQFPLPWGFELACVILLASVLLSPLGQRIKSVALEEHINILQNNGEN